VRTYIFSGERKTQEKSKVRKFLKASLIFHVVTFVCIISFGYFFDISPQFQLEAIEARIVMKGKPRKKNLLPRVVKKKVRKKKVVKTEGKANSLKKTKPDKKVAKKKPEKKKIKQKKEKKMTLEELLAADMEDIKKDARAEETDEGVEDGDENGDVVDPSLAIKGNLYARKVKNIFSKNWKVSGLVSPEELKRLKTLVVFRLTFTGEVYDIQISNKSGNKIFDSSVIEAIKKTGKIPLPTDKKLKKYILQEGLECGFTRGS